MCTMRMPITEDDIRSPGTLVTSDCELPCEGWELNPSLLQEHWVVLTPEPFLPLYTAL